jgi:hypothetical protein
MTTNPAIQQVQSRRGWVGVGALEAIGVGALVAPGTIAGGGGPLALMVSLTLTVIASGNL